MSQINFGYVHFLHCGNKKILAFARMTRKENGDGKAGMT